MKKKHRQCLLWRDTFIILFASHFLFLEGRERDERLLYAPPSSRNSPGSHPWGSNRFSPTNGSAGNNGGSYDRQGSPKVSHIMGPMSPPQAVAHKFSQLFSNKPAINVEKARAFPVMVLSEIFPDIKIEWTQGSGRGDRQFKVEAEVQGRRFFGEVGWPFRLCFLFRFFLSYFLSYHFFLVGLSHCVTGIVVCILIKKTPDILCKFFYMNHQYSRLFPEIDLASSIFSSTGTNQDNEIYLLGNITLR